MARHRKGCPVVMLSRQINTYFLQNKQSDETRNEKEEFRQRLEKALKELFKLNEVKLYNVGSTFNGLGDDDCDLDLCLSINSRNNTREKKITILRAIKQNLYDNYEVQSRLVPAKVVLLKLENSKNFKFSKDLNVNETVGVINSYLIKWYTELDERVQPLAIVIKHWAEKNGIESAANGALSSYSWSLMLIYYLQVGCEPPVLPCFHNRKPISWMLSDYNDWIDEIHEIVPPYITSNNNDTLGDLLLGFFRFYSEFNFCEDSVSIRIGNQARLRNRDAYIFIEEPFNRTNTARYLKHSFYIKILNSLSTAYETLAQTCNLNSIL